MVAWTRYGWKSYTPLCMIALLLLYLTPGAKKKSAELFTSIQGRCSPNNQQKCMRYAQYMAGQISADTRIGLEPGYFKNFLLLDLYGM